MHKTIFGKMGGVILGMAFAGPALAIDECLVGSWTPEPGAMAAQFEQNASLQNVEIIGAVVMGLSHDGGAYDLNGMVIKVRNPGMPPMEMTMNGIGEFAATAQGGHIAFTMGVFNYAVEAKIDMGGTPMVMDIPFSEEMAPMGQGALGTYTCSDTSLTFVSDGEPGKLINMWVRQ